MAEPSYLAAVRESYDTVAAAYAERVPRPESMDPLSSAVLVTFAERVRGGAGGPVADLGCGPGLITGYLAGMGLDAFGIDVSPEMISLARAAHPGLRFETGSMTGLDLADGSLGGILAWFSTHHTPPDLLPLVYAEFARTLAPGGRLLLGTHTGDGRVRGTRAYGGLPVSYESHLLPPERIAGLLATAGFVVTARLVQEPGPGQKRQQACLLARKPEQAEGDGSH
jgi:SAM-dependent methyltransferase